MSFGSSHTLRCLRGAPDIQFTERLRVLRPARGLRDIKREVSPLRQLLKATTVAEQFSARLWAPVLYLWENLGNFLWELFVIVLIFLIGRTALLLFSRLTGDVMRRSAQDKRLNAEQVGRFSSIMTVLRSFARYVIYCVCIGVALGRLGLGGAFENVIVTAGIGGLAISLGAQSLIKDLISGLFILFDRQYSVGDYVCIDKEEGTITAIAMRATYIRTYCGAEIIIPNGSITKVINYSRLPYLALVTFTLDHSVDLSAVLPGLEAHLREVALARPDLLVPGSIEQPLSVIGVAAITEYGPQISVKCLCRPLMHWQMERELRLAVIEYCRKNQILLAHRLPLP